MKPKPIVGDGDARLHLIAEAVGEAFPDPTLPAISEDITSDIPKDEKGTA